MTGDGDVEPVVGIVGCGRMGSAVAELLSRRGVRLCLASRRSQYAQRLAGRLRGAAAGSAEWVAAHSDAILLATPVLASYQEIADRIGPSLRGKPIIDVSNPALCGALDRSLSGAEVIASAFPESTVVKALNCVSARQLANLRTSGVTVPIAGDDGPPKRLVTSILERAGFDVADAGSLSAAKWIEALTQLLVRLGHTEGIGDAVAFHLVRLNGDRELADPVAGR